MTEQELFDKILTILEDKVITNTYSDVLNGATVAQLIMLEVAAYCDHAKDKS